MPHDTIHEYPNPEPDDRLPLTARRRLVRRRPTPSWITHSPGHRCSTCAPNHPDYYRLRLTQKSLDLPAEYKSMVAFFVQTRGMRPHSALQMVLTKQSSDAKRFSGMAEETAEARRVTRRSRAQIIGQVARRVEETGPETAQAEQAGNEHAANEHSPVPQRVETARERQQRLDAELARMLQAELADDDAWDGDNNADDDTDEEYPSGAGDADGDL